VNPRLPQLVGAIAGGEAAALEELYEVAGPHIYSVARSILRSCDDADEIVGDARDARHCP
jgi:DNA-directed RNA polymerase specialized sigma24 family protein